MKKSWIAIVVACLMGFSTLACQHQKKTTVEIKGPDGKREIKVEKTETRRHDDD